MAIDFGPTPVGTPPTEAQKTQIKSVLSLSASDIVDLGTSATTDASAYATAAQGIAAGAGPLRVACVGTSITAQGSTLVTDNVPRINDLGGGYTGWLEHLSNHRVRLVRRNGVQENFTDKTFGYPGFGLVGLTNGSNGFYPLDNAIASGAEVLVLEGGTNDTNETSAVIVSRITAYWTKAVNSGKRVIALNILPTGGVSTSAISIVTGQTYEIEIIGNTPWESIGAPAGFKSGTIFTATANGSGNGRAIAKTTGPAIAKRDVIANVNSDLPAIASSLGVTLINTHSVATLIDGFSTIESTWDSIHETPSFAHRIAVLINTALAPNYSTRAASVIVPNATSALWLTASNSPSGSVMPTGWSKAGTFTDTYTAITDPDGTTWQRVRIIQGGVDYAAIGFQITTSTGYAVGDRVRFACRIRAVNGATFDCRDVQFSGYVWDGNGRYMVAISQGNNLGTGDFDPITGMFVSPEFVIASGTTQIRPELIFYNKDVTFDVRQFGIYKVISNH